jgi:preprotein translocase subunit SecA
VETAQKRVEQRNYLMRKRSLEFDDVMNKQREVIYGWRNDAITTDNPRQMLEDVIEETIPAKVLEFLPPDGPRDPDGLLHWINVTCPLALTLDEAPFAEGSADSIASFLMEKVRGAYNLKSAHEDPDALRNTERMILLNAIDRLWQEHLYGMDALREGVYLRAYGQKDPLVEFKTEAYEMFELLMGRINGEILHNLFRSASNLMAFEQFLASLPQFLQSADETGGVVEEHAPSRRASSEPSLDAILAARQQAAPQPVQVGRNDPCPCGSGRKFKSCCGKTA